MIEAMKLEDLRLHTLWFVNVRLPAGWLNHCPPLYPDPRDRAAVSAALCGATALIPVTGPVDPPEGKAARDP